MSVPTSTTENRSPGSHVEHPQLDADVDESQLDLPKEFFLFPKQNQGFQIPFYLTSIGEVSKIRPPAVVKTWEQRLAELSPEQQKTLAEFVNKVEAAPWYNKDHMDSWTCLRYLCARSYDIKKAFAMLETSVKWREETGADDWQCDACMKDPNHHMGQFVGWDKEYRPVMYMAMRWGPERKEPLRHMIANFNHLIRLMPVGVEKWVCITDFETYSHRRDGNPSMGLGVINVIQNHYPERLGKMICVNPPTMFWVLYKLFYPFIDPVTRKKVDFLYTEDKPSMYDVFPQLFPPLLCEFLYDSYNRSKHNLPRKTLVWHPDAEGYPKNFEERKKQLKDNKNKSKEERKSEKHASK